MNETVRKEAGVVILSSLLLVSLLLLPAKLWIQQFPIVRQLGGGDLRTKDQTMGCTVALMCERLFRSRSVLSL